MAWIVKPSATQDIERRDEPYLTDDLRRHLEQEILPRYATRRAALLPTLHALQHRYNWIPMQAVEEAADFLGISPAEALDTASFYEEFHLRPKGRYLIQVCQSLSCQLCGQEDLLDRLTEWLGIEPGQTTPDGKFTLETIECLGSCGTAPAVMVQEQLQEQVTWESLRAYLESLE